MLRQLFSVFSLLLLGLVLVRPAFAQHAPSFAARLGGLPAELLKSKKTDSQIVDALFLAALTREPTEAERARLTKSLHAAKNREETGRDIVWALVNSSEFTNLHLLHSDPAKLKEFHKNLTHAWPDRKEVQTSQTVGILITRGDKFLEVRADGEEKPRRYHARWLPGPPPGFDKGMLKTFQEVPIGSRLLLEWISTNHGPQVQNLEVLKAAPEKK